MVGTKVIVNKMSISRKYQYCCYSSYKKCQNLNLPFLEKINNYYKFLSKSKKK